MRVSIIAALATNGVIGRNNTLPWHVSSDLKRFKQLTTGHHLLQGRKTWDSVGKPLPDRVNVIITRRDDYAREGFVVVHSLDEGLRLAENSGDAEAFVGGGSEIFAQALHRADRMYLTRVHADVDGDTYFPEFDDVAEWQLTDSEHYEADEKNDHPFSFLTYDRIAAGGHPIPEEG